MLGNLRLIAAAALVLLLAAPRAGVASPTTVTYAGALEIDGTAFTGVLEMRFRILADSDGSEAWAETWASDVGTSAVAVTDGLFEVQLGTYVPLEPGDYGRLEIEYRALGAGTWIALSGEDRLGIAPRSYNFADGDVITVTGLATLRGDLNVGTLNLERDLILNEATSLQQLSLGELEAEPTNIEFGFAYTAEMDDPSIRCNAEIRGEIRWAEPDSSSDAEGAFCVCGNFATFSSDAEYRWFCYGGDELQFD